VKKKQIPFESMLSIYNVATAILLMVVHTLVSAHPNIPKAYLQNREVVCPGYSYETNTFCDCDGDCNGAPEWCSCEEAKACCKETQESPSGSDGWCEDENGRDQNDGTFGIPGHFPTSNSCYNACINEKIGKTVTGCEYHVGGSCSYHTLSVSSGSGNTDYTCWAMTVGYKGATELKWCADNEDVAIRNGCTSDKDCLNNGRTICDRDPDCHGIAWYRNSLNVGMKICRSTRMATKTDGWRTMMKIE